MVINKNFKKIKISEEKRDEKITEISKSIDFNGNFLIIKSLLLKEKLDHSKEDFGEFEFKEIYLSPDLNQFEVHEKEYKANI